VTVIAKVGLLEHGGKVRTAEGVFEVRAGPDGWFEVGGPGNEGGGKVYYDRDQDRLEIQRPGATVSIAFHSELEHTTFAFRGHTYEIATMDFGNVSIKEAGRPVVQGHETVSGVRLLSVASELVPIERELAFGLAVRGAAVDEDNWREDEPFLEGLKQGAEGAFLREDARLRHE
jgi:hypothetical protein